MCALHANTLGVEGGEYGILNETSLQSAVAAPENFYAYELGSPRRLNIEIISRLAVCYWYHICSNHGFVDGNKRTAYMSAKASLLMNGYRLVMPHNLAERASLDVAEGKMDRDTLFLKVRPHVRLRVLKS